MQLHQINDNLSEDPAVSGFIPGSSGGGQPDSIRRQSPALHTWIALGLIVFVALVSYANALRGDFVWDDKYLIKYNETIRSWSNLPQVLTSDLFQNSLKKVVTPGYYRPMVNFSFMLDYSLWGQRPAGYHITNLIWHIACGIIIYFLVLALANEPQLSIITSLLFVTHPVHTESVAWISGRTDVICSFFFLTSLYLYTLARINGCQKRNLCFGMSIVSFVLALASKEVAVYLPLILILMDCLFVIKEFSLRRLLDRARFWIPYWIILFAFLVIYFKSIGINLDVKANVVALDRSYRMLTIAGAVIYYLKTLIYPVTLNPYIMMDIVTSVFSLEVILALLILGGSLYLAYVMRKTGKEISFAIIFFWISMIPLINIIPIHTTIDTLFPMAIRYLYLPSFAFCLLSAVSLRKLAGLRFKRISPGIMVIAFLLLFYTGETIYANTFWLHDTAFYSRALELSPQSPSMNLAAAKTFFRMRNYDAAISCYLKTIQLRNNLKDMRQGITLSTIYISLSRCYFLKGNLPEAIATAKTAIKHNYKNAKAHLSLGKYYQETGNYALAQKEYSLARELYPAYREAMANERKNYGPVISELDN